MSSRARIGIVLAAVVVLVVAFVVASGTGDDNRADDRAAATAPTPAPPPGTDTEGATGTQAPTTEAAPPAPAVPVVTVKDAKPVGGIQKLTFTKGDAIRFTVKSDTTDEIHFHGYDVHEDV